MDNFEKYLSDFNSTINIWEFLINLVVVTVIAYISKQFYVKYGRAVSNRGKFSSTFLPLALSTLLIITVIKSSISLSLGLVGALSIVRFRAAIKDPEELIFLFLMVGLGVTGGANKPILAVVSFAFILPLLYINHRASDKTYKSHVKGKAFLNITTTSGIESITNTLKDQVISLDLRRYDQGDSTNFISYLVDVKDVAALAKITDSLKSVDSNAKVSFIDQPDVAL